MTTTLTDIAEYQLHLKQMELNSLLEVTQAINNNLPEDDLYKIYHFILRANLRIQKLLLCIRQERWQQKAVFGTNHAFGDVHQYLAALHLTEVTNLAEADVSDVFREFDTLIPVFHRESVLAYVFVSQAAHEAGPGTDTGFIQTLTNLIAVAVENKRLAALQLEQEAINRELQTAKRVQGRLFPAKLPQTPTLTVKAEYLPHQSVSGDYYDFVGLPDGKCFFCIADVSGKGIPAALLMSSFQASVRILVRQTTDLPRIIKELNYALYEILAGERYVTGFFAFYDQPNRRLTYINAGHHPPLLIGKHGETQWLTHGTTVVGTFDELPFVNFAVLENLDDFLLFCYTDGVVETRNAQEEEFGEDRMRQVLDAHHTQDPDILHQALLKALNAFRADTPFPDDVTMLTVKSSQKLAVSG
ncbi:MAG: PP2C family protein-serine/threonine phosphatase [Cytophagales bacterium]|jgi:sigma-B regulation protein RsbU (phosphoserine phosphatase)|nr:PP2C family protein-serine/threonine phosphatase [Cytophagales bacterium]